MTIAARLEVGKATDRRYSRRRKLHLDLSLSGTPGNVTIHDLSATGMLIETDAELAPFDNLQVDLPEVGMTQAFIVWTSGRYYGCQFTNPVSKAAISAALLVSPPPRLSTSSLVADAVDPPSAKPPVDYAEAEASDEKAPLRVRLRVILGGAIVLWALIIWAARSLIDWMF